MTAVTKLHLTPYQKEQLEKVRKHVPDGWVHPPFGNFRPEIRVANELAREGDSGKSTVDITVSHLRYRPFNERTGDLFLGDLDYRTDYTHASLTVTQARKLVEALTEAIEATERGEDWGDDY